jgi:hypothetical protein
MADDRLYQVGGFLEAVLEDRTGGPLLRKAQKLTGSKAVW